MSAEIRHYMDKLIADGVEFQVGLRGAGQPIGPAKVEKVECDGASQLYRMLVPAMVQADQQSRAKSVSLPLIFDASDVLMVMLAPLNRDGESAIIPMNGRTAGGLHIPGGS